MMRAKLITKRRFLTGVASSAAVAAAVSGRATPWGPGPATPRATAFEAAPVEPTTATFDSVVLNERYSDARLFARTLAARGVPVLPIAGDAGTLWYGMLRKQVNSGRGCIAGMGTPTDLMILESLGREAGLRVQFRAQHDARGRRTLTHSISGNDGPSLAEGLDAPDWAARLAAALPRVAGGLVTTHIERAVDHPGMLVSWVLARRENT